jgi:hypothetical protein
MLRLNIILISSLVIFLLPFLGFPQGFDNFLYVVLAIVIFASAFLLKIGFTIKEKIVKEKEIEKNIQ